MSFLLLTYLASPAQPPPPESPVLRVEVQLVNVEVAVIDAAGNFVADLKPQNFRLREDGVEQTLAHFAPTQAPVRIALLVEASPAVFLIRHDHLTTAYHLLRGLRATDAVALLSYDRELHREVDFTTNKAVVERHLGSLGRFGVGMAEMNLLDAVAGTLDWLTPPPRRTAVLVVGTGLDTGSTTGWNQLQERVGASQVTFFTVATGRLLRGAAEQKKTKRRRRKPAANNPDIEAAFVEADIRLRALAQASAGRAYFPESAAELDEIYREIAEHLRNLYSLGYYPLNTARDGRYRRITVELVDESGAPLVLRDPQGKPMDYRVFARPGYFAPAD